MIDPRAGKEAQALFAVNPRARPQQQLVGGRLPVLIVDNVFSHPEEIRSAALRLSYSPPSYAYPGRIADPGRQDGSLEPFLGQVLAMVNDLYLPKVPPIAANGRPITKFARVEADFAITEVHPDELTETQRKPHVDPVPIFGLVYLNPQDRGGTLFFEPSNSAPARDRLGYCSTDDGEFRFIGKIEGLFNRMAIYPGFVPHSGEIEGDWIRTDERFLSPRLTQRLVFFP